MSRFMTNCTMILLFACMLSFVNSETLYCNANSVNIRTEPDGGSEIIGRLSKNDSIMPIEENAGWFKIHYQGQEAWVYKAFFSGIKPQKTETGKYWYNSESGVLHNVNCRWFGNTKNGYYTDEELGRDCSIWGAWGQISTFYIGIDTYKNVSPFPQGTKPLVYHRNPLPFASRGQRENSALLFP